MVFLKYGKGIKGECGKVLKKQIIKKKMPESSNHKAEIRIFDGHDQQSRLCFLRSGSLLTVYIQAKI